MGTLIEPQKSISIPSQMFNFLTVVNDSSKEIYVEAMHNDIGAPMVFIRDPPSIKSEDKDDKKCNKNIIADPSQAKEEKKVPEE